MKPSAHGTGRERRLRIATRSSALALAQTRWVAERLRSFWPALQVQEVHVVTRGDRIQHLPLSQVGGKGLFVSEVENALLEDRADLAVHSLKDVPAELAVGLELACIPEREDPRDVLVTEQGLDLDDLSAGDRVGTGSLRRQLQLHALRNDLEYAPLRGNVDTRLRKLAQGHYRAIVLAHAGLRRLGLADRPLRALPVDRLIPSVGQGALALQARTDDRAVRELLAPLEHPPSRACVEAERAFLRELGGDCNVPLAGHARLENDGSLLRFDALVGSVQTLRHLRAGGDRYLEQTRRPLLEQAVELGREVAQTLLDQGAGEMIQQAIGNNDPRQAPSLQ